MTLTVPNSRRPRGASLTAGRAPWIVVVVAGVVLGWATTLPSLLGVATAACATAALAASCSLAARRSLLALIVWLVVAGTVRRILLAAGSAAENDPLLLVEPVVAGVLVLVAAREGCFRKRTPLTKAVMALSGLVILSVVNPLGSGIVANAASLLFVLVPMLWFWIGRSLMDNELFGRILRLVGALALGAALYGLFQLYVGFPSWDKTWIEAKSYTSLRVSGSLRQFGSFSSTAEYVGFLSIGLVVWALTLKKRHRWVPAVSVLTVIVWAILVASVRGAVVVLPVALGIVFAAARGWGFGRIVLLGLGALVLVGAVVSRLDPSSVGGARTSALLGRQVTGLSDPFNPKVSSLPGHVSLVVDGIKQAARNPLGSGLGRITVAGQKFGSASTSTETDPSNMAVALGLPGLVIYGWVVVAGLRLAFHRVRERRDWLVLCALGVLLVTSLQWLNGGSYVVAAMPWLVMGWLDRPEPTDPALNAAPVEE